MALGVAGAVGSALRLFVSRRPPTVDSGGWRELTGPELD